MTLIGGLETLGALLVGEGADAEEGGQNDFLLGVGLTPTGVLNAFKEIEQGAQSVVDSPGFKALKEGLASLGTSGSPTGLNPYVKSADKIGIRLIAVTKDVNEATTKIQDKLYAQEGSVVHKLTAFGTAIQTFGEEALKQVNGIATRLAKLTGEVQTATGKTPSGGGGRNGGGASRGSTDASPYEVARARIMGRYAALERGGGLTPHELQREASRAYDQLARVQAGMTASDDARVKAVRKAIQADIDLMKQHKMLYEAERESSKATDQKAAALERRALQDVNLRAQSKLSSLAAPDALARARAFKQAEEAELRAKAHLLASEGGDPARAAAWVKESRNRLKFANDQIKAVKELNQAEAEAWREHERREKAQEAEEKRLARLGPNANIKAAIRRVDPKELTAKQAKGNVWDAILKSIFGIDEGLSRTIPKVVTWSIATGAVYTTMRLIASTMTTISEMDQARLRLERGYRGTDMTGRQAANRLTGAAGNLAGQYGYEIPEIQKQQEEFVRSGHNVMDTIELTTKALQLQRATGMESGEATKFLITQMHEYGLSVSEVGHQVDRLNELQKTSRASLQDIGEGVAKAGFNAKEAGIPIEKLNAIVATLIDETGEKGSQVGTRLNMMLGKAGSDQGLKKFAQELHVPIEFDIPGSTHKTFKDMSTVLEELAAKWHTLGDEERKHAELLLSRMGNYGMFVALMENYGKVLERTTLQAMSMGSTERDAARMMDTVTGKLERIKQIWTAMMVDPNNAGGLSAAIKNNLDALIGIMKNPQAVADLEIAAKGLVALAISVKTFSASLALLQGFSAAGGLGGLIIDFKNLASAFKAGGIVAALGITAESGPVIWAIVAAMTALGGAVYAYHHIMNETHDSSLEFEKRLDGIKRKTGAAVDLLGGAHGFAEQLRYAATEMRSLEKSTLSQAEKEKQRQGILAGLKPVLDRIKQAEIDAGVAANDRISTFVNLEPLAQASLRATGKAMEDLAKSTDNTTASTMKLLAVQQATAHAELRNSHAAIARAKQAADEFNRMPESAKRALAGGVSPGSTFGTQTAAVSRMGIDSSLLANDAAAAALVSSTDQAIWDATHAPAPPKPTGGHASDFPKQANGGGGETETEKGVSLGSGESPTPIEIPSDWSSKQASAFMDVVVARAKGSTSAKRADAEREKDRLERENEHIKEYVRVYRVWLLDHAKIENEGVKSNQALVRTQNWRADYLGKIKAEHPDDTQQWDNARKALEEANTNDTLMTYRHGTGKVQMEQLGVGIAKGELAEQAKDVKQRVEKYGEFEKSLQAMSERLDGDSQTAEAVRKDMLGLGALAQTFDELNKDTDLKHIIGTERAGRWAKNARLISELHTVAHDNLTAIHNNEQAEDRQKQDDAFIEQTVKAAKEGLEKLPLAVQAMSLQTFVDTLQGHAVWTLSREKMQTAIHDLTGVLTATLDKLMVENVDDWIKFQEDRLAQSQEHAQFAKEMGGAVPFANEATREGTEDQWVEHLRKRALMLRANATEMVAAMLLPHTEEQAKRWTEKLAAWTHEAEQIDNQIVLTDAQRAAKIEEQMTLLRSWGRIGSGDLGANASEGAKALQKELDDAEREYQQAGMGSTAKEILGIQQKVEDARKSQLALFEKDVEAVLAWGEDPEIASYIEWVRDQINGSFDSLITKHTDAWVKAFEAKAAEELGTTIIKYGREEEAGSANLRYGAAKMGLAHLSPGDRARAEAELDQQRRLEDLERQRQQYADDKRRALSTEMTGADKSSPEYMAKLAAVNNDIEANDKHMWAMRLQIEEDGNRRLLELEQQRFDAIRGMYLNTIAEILGDVTSSHGIHGALKKLGEQLLKQDMQSGTQRVFGGRMMSTTGSNGPAATQAVVGGLVAGGMAVGSAFLADSDSTMSSVTAVPREQVLRGITAEPVKAGQANAARRNFAGEIGGKNTLGDLGMLYGIASNATSPGQGALQGAVSGFFGSGGNPIMAGIGLFAGLFGGLFHHKKPTPPPELKLPSAHDLMWSAPGSMPATMYLGGRGIPGGASGSQGFVNTGTINIAVHVANAQEARAAGEAFAAGMTGTTRSFGLDAARVSQGRL